MSEQLQNQPTTLPRWEFWFGVGFFVLTLCGLAGLFVAAQNLWQSADVIPVERLVIHGERRFISNEDVQRKLLAHGALPSFAELDVNKVQQELLQLPWVDDVAVRKEYPDRLHVNIVEFKPIARWQESQAVSNDGRLFNIPNHEVIGYLPLIKADDHLVADAINMLDEVAELTSQPEFQIKELTISARQAWRLVLSNGIELILGKDERKNRLARFFQLLPAILNAQGSLPLYVDLRYDTGAAVAWQQVSQELVSQHGKN